MNGLAEKQDGLARKLVSILKIGNAYTLEEMASILNQKPNAVSRKGVLTSDGSDAQILLVTLEKDKYSTPGYFIICLVQGFFGLGRTYSRQLRKSLLQVPMTRSSFFRSAERLHMCIMVGQSQPGCRLIGNRASPHILSLSWLSMLHPLKL